VVEHLTHNPKIDGSNPTTGTRRENMVSKSRNYKVVKKSTHDPNNKGLNPTTGTKRENMVSKAANIKWSNN
jgi:hypothetical protein